VYGGGSIKKNGIYDQVLTACNQAGKMVVELANVLPNPRTEKVYEGIQLCRDYSVDFILAVGGGSVIDCAKAVAVGAKTDKDFWETFYVNQEQTTDALPLGTILTMSATGTEMNANTVISNRETHEKHGYGSDLLYPVFSILDPTYTYSLPADQTAYGAVDILAHVFEQYFSFPNEDNVSDNLAEAVMRSVIDNIETAIHEPNNYLARSNIMRASTMALNELIGMGKEQDRVSHNIEHALSGLYDIPHGAGLAIVFPARMQYVYKAGLPKFVRYAKNIRHVTVEGKTDEEIALEGIEATKQFFRKI
jgi:alcohol dehydrogenase YqhD (iron-dependent ADH family)